MHHLFQSVPNNEKGSALIVSVLVLMVVTSLGIIATRTATVEMQIATYDKFYKMTWFATDAVVDGLMPELIEQNIELRGFGDEAPPFTYGPTSDLEIYTSDFYLNPDEGGTCESYLPSSMNRDIQMADIGGASVPVRVMGRVVLTDGNSMLLPEGYHGRGKGVAGGGASLIYTIRGLGQGLKNSQTRIAVQWRHQI